MSFDTKIREIASRVKVKPILNNTYTIASLNNMWREGLLMCCFLPCNDKMCRDDMNKEGGCPGADFADLIFITEENDETK